MLAHTLPTGTVLFQREALHPLVMVSHFACVYFSLYISP